MNQDAEHLRLLSVFHYVCAGMAALFACFPVLHLALGLVMVFRPEAFGSHGEPPPAFFGWFFVIFASAFMLAGWTFAVLVAYAGRCLAKRTKYLYCFVIAAVACMFMPIGTVLGVFTIIVLMRPTVKEMFSPTPAKP